MRLTIDLDSLAFIVSRTDRNRVSRITAKRGDHLPLEIQFARGGQLVRLAEGTVVTFGVKPLNQFDAVPVVLEAGFVQSAVADPDAPTWTGAPNLNTTELNALFQIDGNPGNDPAFVDLMAEATWIAPGDTGPTTTQTISFRVANDVIRGDEGTPTSQPTPEQWIEARAVLYDREQTLDAAEQLQAQQNIGLPKNNFAATVAPGVADDSTAGFAVGSKWFDTVGGEAYICADPTEGAAVWLNSTLTPDDLGDAAFRDSSVGGNGVSDSDKLVRFGAQGNLFCSSENFDAFSAASETGDGVRGQSFGGGRGVLGLSDSGSGVFGFSTSGAGVLAFSDTGSNHAEFGTIADNRSFVRRILGLFGWYRGAFAQTLGSPAALTADREVTLPDASGEVTVNTATQTLSGKTLIAPVLNGYTEGSAAIGTVTTAHTIDIAAATVQTATLTASTECTFTLPAPAAGKSFVLYLTQADPTGLGTAVFTGVKWPGGIAPTITPDPAAIDILSFVSDGTSWFGTATQAFA